MHLVGEIETPTRLESPFTRRALIIGVRKMGGSREVWLNVGDVAAWVRADTTSDVGGDTVSLKRRDNGATVTIPQEQFAKL